MNLIFALIITVCSSVNEPTLKPVTEGLLWQPANQTTRIRFLGNTTDGYDVVFERQADDSWQPVASLPKGQVWNVYSDWKDSWYAKPHHVKAQKIEALGDGRVRASAEADIDGQRWWFTDVYSLEHGMIRIDRSFAHTDAGSQSKITLESRIRVPLGTEQRVLIPGVLYNNNPSSTLIGTKVPTESGGLGLYEEHRLPIPMVNIESAVEGRRLFGSLVTKPSKILQGHKGNDHWWSTGLQYGKGYADLLSVSGPVATNGMKSHIYGHRHGFDAYDDAWLDVQGPSVFTKTLYVDLGSEIKTGYAFRETLWKAFELFQPTETPHPPFAETMTLVTEYAKTRFCGQPRWKIKKDPVRKNHAMAVVRFGKVQIVEGDALVIGRPDGKKDVYQFYDTGKQDPYSSDADPNRKVIGIEICEPDAWFTKTIDRVIAAINANRDSSVTAKSPKVLAPEGESWGMKLIAKISGPEGCKIQLADQGGKLEFTSKLFGPWGLMGTEPKTDHLILFNAADQQKDPAGFRRWANHGLFQYAWCGGNLGIAYGLLAHADRTDDPIARCQAIDTVQFFIHQAQAGTEGLYYGDYNVEQKCWIPGHFDGGTQGISSRQLGENLEHLASLVELGRRMRLPEAEQWFTALKKTGDFLLRSPRPEGMFPRAWTPEGDVMEWNTEQESSAAAISTSGAQCVCLLARIAKLTGETKYRDVASEVMDAYWHKFGETLAKPYWGATIDAGAEDKEAGWGVMRAALETYEATKKKRFLSMAKDAADWTLTWMYFHNIDLKPEAGLLHEHLHTIGWTFISTQNQEIDVWGYWMAPDYYRLGLATGDKRYLQIGKVLFEAASQTVSRPGAMFGPTPGIQAEHYNHSNCTYAGGHPGSWRGTQHAMGISWTFAGALYGGNLLAELAPEHFSLNLPAAKKKNCYEFQKKPITVDGNSNDWRGVEEHIVEGSKYLWFGQGMTPDKWQGNQDLSFRWRGAWYGDRLYLLINVSDDHLDDFPRQPCTYLNDCIEIMLDPLHLGGPRKEVINGKECLRGYEMHFLPSKRPVIIIDDVIAPGFPTSKPQNKLFRNDWNGEISTKKTATGYLMEIAFSVPGLRLQEGKTIGLDVAVCDADGASRESLQIESGNQGKYWVNMDTYPEIMLAK